MLQTRADLPFVMYRLGGHYRLNQFFRLSCYRIFELESCGVDLPPHPNLPGIPTGNGTAGHWRCPVCSCHSELTFCVVDIKSMSKRSIGPEE